MDDLYKFIHLWTVQKKEHFLFTVTCYGKTEYLLYHRPTKKISLIADGKLGRRLINKLIEAGMPLLDDAPDCLHEYPEVLGEQAIQHA